MYGPTEDDGSVLMYEVRGGGETEGGECLHRATDREYGGIDIG